MDLCGYINVICLIKHLFLSVTEGSTRTFRIVHIMRDNPLTGISDIGIQLRKLETIKLPNVFPAQHQYARIQKARS